MQTPFQLSDEQQQALDCVTTGESIFLTGPGGTGKSETINRIIEELTLQGRRFAVCASTGIAAVRIGGCTIHSCLGTNIINSVDDLKVAIKHGKLNLDRATWKLGALDTIILDEVSMLSGDYITMMDWWLRTLLGGTKKPFGGIQVIFSGDFLQLPPVIRYDQPVRDEYAPASKSWQKLNPKIIYLTKIFRQDDKEFIRHLNGIRYGNPSSETIDYFNARVGAPLKLPVQLYAKNAAVDAVNNRELAKLPGAAKLYEAEFSGDQRLWSKLARDCIVPDKLRLKPGAPVLFARNKYEYGPPVETLFINGERGVIEELADDTITVKKDTGEIVFVEPERWGLYNHQHKEVAAMEQFPLKLAWAITIHKSQGMTLSAMRCDVSECFSPGHVYVALSRVKTLDGLSLVRPVTANAVEADPDVVQWYRELEQGLSVG